MAKTQPQTIALNHQLEDQKTGAIASHHVVTTYMVNLIQNNTTATFGSYASASAHDGGKSPLSFTTVTVEGVPDEGSSLAWIYKSVLTYNDPLNPLAGAVAVTAASA